MSGTSRLIGDADPKRHQTPTTYDFTVSKSKTKALLFILIRVKGGELSAVSPADLLWRVQYCSTLREGDLSPGFCQALLGHKLVGIKSSFSSEENQKGFFLVSLFNFLPRVKFSSEGLRQIANIQRRHHSGATFPSVSAVF